MPAFTTGLAILGMGLSVGMGAYQMNKQKKAMKDIPVPTPPKDTDAEDIARDDARKRRNAQAKSRSTFTSPLGIEDEANIAKKTLLGQ